MKTKTTPVERLISTASLDCTPADKASTWTVAKRKITKEKLKVTIKIATSLSNSPIITNTEKATILRGSPSLIELPTYTQGMETHTPTIATQNRYGIPAECLINNENDNTDQQNLEPPVTSANPVITKPSNIKPPPINLHGNINHFKFLETLKTKYHNNFHIKFTSDKLKIMFHNISNFKEFKDICRNDNIQYHTYVISTEKVLIVVLKGLIKFPEKTIINNLRTQGLISLNCAEIPTHISYPI